MTQALSSAVAKATKLPPGEQDVLAAILLEEIASEQRWSESFARSEAVLESLAAEALAEFKAGNTKPLSEL
jgi:methylase of polypeptide subunit release factors